MDNPITSNPANNLSFPNVTEDELTALLEIAKSKGVQVFPSSAGLSGVITDTVFFVRVEATYFLSSSGDLLVQCSSHPDEIREQIEQALEKIRKGGQ